MSEDDRHISLCSAGNWHFFIKKDNYKFVYLSFYLSHNDVPQGTNITFEAPTEIRIPIDIWRNMIKQWSNSEWGKNYKLDNMTTFGKRMLDDFIKSKSKKEK